MTTAAFTHRPAAPPPPAPGGGARNRIAGCLRALSEFVFPPTCVLCNSEVSGGEPFCPLCHRELPISEHACHRCGAPAGPHLMTTSGCAHCVRDSFAFERAFALGAYDGSLRRACLRAKQDASGRIIRPLTRMLIDRWGSELRQLDVDVVVSIPAHWITRFRRLATPAETAARILARFLMVPCDPHILRKTRWTASQSSLPPTQRRNNLRDAFQLVRGVQLTGARVLVVDDVLTTGTTAHRAARVLLRAGAGAVFVAALARGVGR